MTPPLIPNGLPLTSEEIRRYSRQTLLPQIGQAGQERLKAAKVALVGVGALGSPVALYLAAAGVGTLGLIDPDKVEEANLHRQILYCTADVGRPKTDCACEKLQAINPHVRIAVHPVRLSSANALDLLRDYDVVVDCSDNFPTRYLVNDACVLLHKPDVYGAIGGFEGMTTVFAPHLNAPCYRCLYAVPPTPGKVPTCAETGVLGTVPGLIGTIQAMETIKLLIGQGQPLLGRLLRYDALAMTFRELAIARDPNCPLCGTQPTIRQLTDYE